MLNNHSYYSFGYGVRSLSQMLAWAEATGQRQLALTDINNTAAALDFVRLAQEREIRPILGVDFREGVEQRYVALAQDNDGFAEINGFLSRHLMTGQRLPSEVMFDRAFVIYPLKKLPERPLKDREYIGVTPREMRSLKFSTPDEWRAKMVILHQNSFAHRRDFNAHRLLRAITENTLLSKLSADQQSSMEACLQDPDELKNTFAEFPEIVANTEKLLERCSIHFAMRDYTRSQNRQHYGDSAAEDRRLIHSLCQEGLEYRFGKASPEVEQRLAHELEVIEKRGFYSYFLINWDIVNYARRQGYYYVGRGSGANSLVAYLLRITDVDPIALDLYFERFMNMSRQQPPDFDIDFSWRDRQDVTRYIFERFPRAVLLGAHNTFQPRVLHRELGKVLGLPSRDIEAIRKAPSYSYLDEMQQLVLKYGELIKDFPHRPTLHSSGILIPEADIYQYGSTFMPPKGFPTVHFNMYAAEDVGLYKFDILGQRGLAKIKEAHQLVKQNHPEAPAIDVHNPAPFYEDPRISELLRQGRTMGCFYIESPAMRSLLKKLRCDDYQTLVAASSIVRPGVSKSGMMSEYIKRHREPGRREYIHPRIGELLQETYGVMVYQEDVLKVAHFFAGLSLEEADVLRRGMSWKAREASRFEQIKNSFFENCRKRGYEEKITQEIWRQIESFGNYAFAKGHSASYAVESYQSLYFKAHYPLEYMVATVNNGGGFYSVETYLNEARLHGGVLEPPCINRSEFHTILEGQRLILGWQHLRDLEETTLRNLQEERDQNGPYSSFQEFLDRVAISLEQLIILIRIEAFRQMEPEKKKLLWEAHFHLGSARRTAPVADLFRGERGRPEIPKLEGSPHENAMDQIELLGFPLSSPFHLVDMPEQQGLLAVELPHHIGKVVTTYGYLIHVKNLRTRGARREHMQFGTFLDREGNFIDTVHFPPVAARFPFQGKGVYQIRGKVLSEYDFVSIETYEMKRLPSAEGS